MLKTADLEVLLSAREYLPTNTLAEYTQATVSFVIVVSLLLTTNDRQVGRLKVNPKQRSPSFGTNN
jgi:hypothetical protein